MKVIALMNAKGGVGKTTSVINIAAGLTQLGKRILVLDLDPQAQLTCGLGIQANELDATAGREQLLAEALLGIKGVKDYHFLLIDCPAYLGLLVLNALKVAQEVYIPVQTEFLALHGLRQTVEFVEVAQKQLNPRLKPPDTG